MQRHGFALVFWGITACGSDATSVTYWKDVAPIVQANCQGCHTEGGIGAFPLETYRDAFERRNTIYEHVRDGHMPPWPPGEDCNAYQHDRSLSQEEIGVFGAWLLGGAKEGDQADAPKTAPAPTGLPRVDQVLTMAESYSPLITPDDYRCFLIPWPEANTRYITGFNVMPGDTEVVHHVILFRADPDEAAYYQNRDDNEAGPGYTCFGTADGDAMMISGWVPGSMAREVPAGTGIEMQPGSLVIMQVHYNTNEKEPEEVSDQTTFEVMLDDVVDKPAYVARFLNPLWVDGSMRIPANDSFVQKTFTYDVTGVMSLAGIGLPNDSPFLIYSANVHMHLRGKSAHLEVRHDKIPTRCLLDIPEWDFHWQGDYQLEEPVRFDPLDLLHIECVWDNSAANQPELDGVQMIPTELNWGEGTHDEMCIGFLYVTGL
jgi:hypothetical protein